MRQFRKIELAQHECVAYILFFCGRIQENVNRAGGTNTQYKATRIYNTDTQLTNDVLLPKHSIRIDIKYTYVCISVYKKLNQSNNKYY